MKKNHLLTKKFKLKTVEQLFFISTYNLFTLIININIYFILLSKKVIKVTAGKILSQTRPKVKSDEVNK